MNGLDFYILQKQMSIQTTRFITREEGMSLLLKKIIQKQIEIATPYIEGLSDKEIEEQLDENFYNYSIQ